MFVPREGHAFVVCDYDSIEVRLLAYYLGDPGFRELIAEGHDPHAWMAMNLEGGSMDDYLKGTPGQPIRDKAKNTLFAITYGAGGGRVSDMNKLDPGPWYDEDHPAIVAAREQGRYWPKPGWQYKEGRALVKKIKGALPGYHKLNRRVRSKIETVGYVTTIMGRKQPVKPDKSYVGLNALIQGSAADIMKQGLVNVAEAVAPLGGIPLLVVHDEVVVEVPTERAQECLTLTEAALVGAHDLNPALKVTGSVVTTSYADA
jgi:DNA polymerase-1